MSDYFVYVLRCADGSLYTGLTTDPQRRLAEHNTGGPKGARYTRARLPVALAWLSEPLPDRSSAGALEYRLKAMRLPQKLCWMSLHGQSQIGPSLSQPVLPQVVLPEPTPAAEARPGMYELDDDLYYEAYDDAYDEA